MGELLFSHQWSFGHPDPASEQLEVAQTFLGKVGEGEHQSRGCRRTEDFRVPPQGSNRFLQFAVTEEQIAEDVKSGYVWLDCPSVPRGR